MYNSYELLEKLSEPKKIIVKDGYIAYPYFWQVPAATEKGAFDSLSSDKTPRDFEYIAFPWATLFDSLVAMNELCFNLLAELGKINASEKKTKRRVTVAQHIHAMKYVDIFKKSGITDIFWSHATADLTEIEGIQLHPFPLYPAQTPEVLKPEEVVQDREFLANFIGAYNPKLYITNVREVIFNDPNTHKDLNIIKREAWHFDRAVYNEQVKGLVASQKEMNQEEKNKIEYLDAIKNSWFTLCPTGAGPNSIRIFESLSLGSIPIILTKNLRLPKCDVKWEEAAIIEDDSSDGYYAAIKRARGMSLQEKKKMVEKGVELANKIHPGKYSNLISFE